MKRGLAFLLLGALLLAGIAGAGEAAAQRGYDLSWWTADGGGQTFSTGGNYSLGGTAGQPDAGLLAGPGYHLSGGFWSGAAVVYNVYLPLVLRSYP